MVSRTDKIGDGAYESFQDHSFCTVVGNELRYEGWPAIICAVNTVDAMTATIEEIPYEVLHKIVNRITAEVEGINRVLLDLTPKPAKQPVAAMKRRNEYGSCIACV